MLIFPEVPEDLAALSVEDLEAYIAESLEAIERVAAAPAEFVGEERTWAQLREEMGAAVEALEAARTELGSRDELATEPEAVTEPDEVEETEDEPDEELEADIAALAVRAATEPEPVVVEPETVEPEALEAAAPPAPARRHAPPARARRAAPQPAPEPTVALTAAAGASHLPLGYEFPSEREIAETMINRRKQFGLIPEGLSGEKMPIARASWQDLYPSERHLSNDEISNEAIIAAALNQRDMKAELDRRAKEGLTASGGLCAPVTPYYQLQMVSTADRPVRAALPAFNADRGGIRYAAPATLASITTGVGARTAAQDQAGGTNATKTCQTVDCPAFSETDVEIIFHCLTFGNLGARTFPERVAQWNNLTLAAHSRLAESLLLTAMVGFSTAVTAASLGLGASADLLSQVLTAAAGMRSRHRMKTDAVLRVMLPEWVKDLMVSDVYRTTFGRWDMTADKFVALLRAGNVEPSFYIDGASGKSQVYGTQSAGALLPFPPTVNWLIYPEGSFLYLDGGTLELGLVRDSVLNSTNDFQIFGETFENVAFVGVESLSVVSTLCDNGVTAGTHNVVCPIDYSHTS